MSKAPGNVELALIVTGEFKGLPAPKGWRRPTDVHDHVPNLASRAAHELDFRFGLRLPMETANGSAAEGARHVRLGPSRIEALRGKFPFTVCPRKEAAFIRVGLELDKPHALESGGNELHSSCGVRWRS